MKTQINVKEIFETVLLHSVTKLPLSQRMFIDYHERSLGLANVVMLLSDKTLPTPQQIERFNPQQVIDLTHLLSTRYFPIVPGTEKIYGI